MTNDTNPSRILVGVDGSASSIDALRHGAEIAAAFHAPLEAMTTWQYPVLSDGYYVVPDWSPEDDAKTILSQAVDEAFGAKRPESIITSVRQGSPAAVLIDESEHAAMLVLGSRGHGGFVGMLLGSVSSACATHAHCPVLIMHSPKDSSEAS